MHEIEFDGVELHRVYGVYISDDGIYSAPERDMEAVQIPGRNGDLHIDNGRYSNQTITYTAGIAHDWRRNYDALKAFLLSREGYCRLRDSFRLGVFRKAMFTGTMQGTPNKSLKQISFELQFSADPRMFLLEGEEEITLTASGSILNQTLFSSYPIITVYGTGSLLIGDQMIKVTANTSSGITIDCETMNATSGATDANGSVSLPMERVTLAPGANAIGITGLTKVVITPRWYTL